MRGLFHWTAVDNYEWIHGYDVRFGLIDRHRNVKASAAVLKPLQFTELAEFGGGGPPLMGGRAAGHPLAGGRP